MNAQLKKRKKKVRSIEIVGKWANFTQRILILKGIDLQQEEKAEHSSWAKFIRKLAAKGKLELKNAFGL